MVRLSWGRFGVGFWVGLRAWDFPTERSTSPRPGPLLSSRITPGPQRTSPFESHPSPVAAAAACGEHLRGSSPSSSLRCRWRSRLRLWLLRLLRLLLRLLRLRRRRLTTAPGLRKLAATMSLGARRSAPSISRGNSRARPATMSSSSITWLQTDRSALKLQSEQRRLPRLRPTLPYAEQAFRVRTHRDHICYWISHFLMMSE